MLSTGLIEPQKDDLRACWPCFWRQKGRGYTTGQCWITHLFENAEGVLGESGIVPFVGE